MRTDADQIALRAIRSVLDGAKPFTLDVGAVKVACATSVVPAGPWPRSTRLDEPNDGPWPNGVDVDCRWDGGACHVVVDASCWSATAYRGDVCLRAFIDKREIVFVNVTRSIGDAKDDTAAKLRVRFFAAKRKSNVSKEVAEAINDGMRDVLGESQLPMVSEKAAELCEVDVPAGTVSRSAEVFQRLIHLALLKVDFIDRRHTKDRGTPIVDLGRWLTPEQLAQAPLDYDDDEAIEEDEAPARQYWAGGFYDKERLDKFKAEDYWQIGWKRTAENPAAKRTWKRFAGVKPGDYFAIKGLGGKNDLAVRYVGEVVSVDSEAGKIALTPLDVPLYKGKGPTGAKAGNWQDTLVPITRPDIIQLIFGPTAGAAASGVAPTEADAAPPPIDLPRNVIYYGPPGTGKTYLLTHELVEQFRRAPTTADTDAELVEDLTWVQVVALALHDIGGKAKVATLQEHPLVKAKHAASPFKAHLSERLWALLQRHTVETSTTVKYKKRAGEQLFDKTDESLWMLAVDLPEELGDIAKQRKAPPSTVPLDDYVFLTFHQAYAYEDFIEGIRPRVEATTDEDAGGIAYALEDGTFLKACRAALRLAGYEGTLHDFCGLPPERRTRQFEGARPYAVFIDEINRGNVARVFGELITLIEDDKRLGEPNEVIVQLPYSKKRFGVPPNLHMIGTMNTADRSIEALDTALRRRFEFREMLPDPSLLEEFTITGGIEPDEMLRAINQRLEKLYDRDHCIGHAYLYAIKDNPSLDRLKHVFQHKIIPLLQEYFFGDWGKIGLVLGKDFVRKREMPGAPFADFLHDDYDALAEKPTWELAKIEDLSNQAFQRIYTSVPIA